MISNRNRSNSLRGTVLTFQKCNVMFKKARKCKFVDGKAVKLTNNTYLLQMDGYYSVLLHRTYIIDIYPKKWVLRNGGWVTPTTQDRMNRYSPINVWQKNYEWYYDNDKLFVNGLTIEKYDIFEQLI